MNQFMQGAVVMACVMIGLFFLRFWKRSRDRLFLFFAAAFWLLGINWLALSFTRGDEPNTWLYTVRLAAFLVILLGIWDKNRIAKNAAGRGSAEDAR
jgi:peptidoglycan/LPS O-acetylase OafA/YrhL